MTKKEYIKVLREVQNEIKRQLIDSDEFCKLYPMPTEESFMNDKSRYINSMLYPIILMLMSYKFDWPDIITVLFFMIILYKIYDIMYNDNLYKEIIELYETIDIVTDNYEKESVKIENCIEFLNSSTDEEIGKYLSYKINGNKSKIEK